MIQSHLSTKWMPRGTRVVLWLASPSGPRGLPVAFKADALAPLDPNSREHQAHVAMLRACTWARRREHKPRAVRARPPGGLCTEAEAAAKLGISIKTLSGHVAAGSLKYVAVGHGTKRPRRMFTDADLDEFIVNQTRKDSPMSVHSDPRSPFWQYDFQWRGRRFLGSTKCTTRREAVKVEAAEREKAKALVAQTEAARTSLRLDDVAGRYWSEHAQHLAGAPQCRSAVWRC